MGRQVYFVGSTAVYEGEHAVTREKVAIKVLKGLDEGKYAKAERECERQGLLYYHARVVQAVDSFGIKCTNDVLWTFVLILEWIEKDLAKEVAYRKDNSYPFTETELMDITFDLIDTLAELQENGLAHRDVKPQNIFYTSQQHVKIGDFGSSKIQDLIDFYGSFKEETVAGTPYYMSPELKLALLEDFAHTQYNPYKSDVYSLGLTLLFCYIQRPPDELLVLRTLSENTREVVSSVPYRELQGLIGLMLTVDAESRPDFLQLRSLTKPLHPLHCLHLPNHRNGLTFPCHGFFCENCLSDPFILYSNNSESVSTSCPICTSTSAKKPAPLDSSATHISLLFPEEEKLSKKGSHWSCTNKSEISVESRVKSKDKLKCGKWCRQMRSWLPW